MTREELIDQMQKYAAWLLMEQKRKQELMEIVQEVEVITGATILDRPKGPQRHRSTPFKGSADQLDQKIKTLEKDRVTLGVHLALNRAARMKLKRKVDEIEKDKEGVA